MKYLVIIEKGPKSYGAYSPNLPGCAAVGDTEEEVKRKMQEAMALHLQGMLEVHEPIPQPQSKADYIDIPLPA